MYVSLIVGAPYSYTKAILARIVPFLLLVCLPSVLWAAYEQPGLLSAQSLLTPEIQKGKNHSVNDQVHNDGMFNHYDVSSPFGDFAAGSDRSLQQLVNEIGAIAEMKKVKTDDTAIASLKQSGQNTVAGIKNLFNNPEETLQGAASGVSSLFNRAAGTVGSREVSESEDNKMKQLVGFSKSKGQIASQYGVNVYSRNQVLQVELERLAWADYAGGLGVGVATSLVPGVGGLVVTTSGTARLLNEAINTTPASELWLQNKNKLLGMGIDEDTVVLFLNNQVFSPALTTVMTTAMDAMKGVANRELFLKVGLQASTAEMARIIAEITVLTAGYHKNIAPLKQVTTMARITRAVKKDGSVVVVLPTDHIIWSEKIADVAITLADETKSAGGAGLEMWVLGDFSQTAQTELEAQGWQLHTKARNQLLPPDK